MRCGRCIMRGLSEQEAPEAVAVVDGTSMCGVCIREVRAERDRAVYGKVL